MANTSFKVDNGLLVTGGDSLFQANVTVNAHVIVRQSISVAGNLTVTGNLEYSNTSIDGNLIPTANGKALGNTTRTFDVFAGNINLSNSIVTANGTQINLRAASGIVANSTGFTVNASAISNGVLNIGQGGTNGSTRAAGLNNLLPTQNAAVNGYYLRTDGTDASWISGVGFTGSKGDKGDRGDVGYTGSQGSIGYTGSAGTNGGNGDVGFTGSKGDKGDKGDRGDVGFTGSQGSIGYTGSAGTNGGNGDVGFTGSRGDVGFTGSRGDVGFTGSKGDIGYTGSASTVVGYTGSRGDVGFTGSASTVVGYTGSRGDIGYTGSASTVVGYTGSQGPAGPVAGSSTTVQFNDGGVANGSANFTFTKSTAFLYVNGDVQAADFVVASDDTLKDVIGNIPNALDIINSLDGIRYTWNELGQQLLGYKGDKIELGVLAQQIEKELPELIAMSNNGDYKMVAYARLTAVLIEAVKELSAKVDALENQ